MAYLSREYQDVVDIAIQQFGELESGLFQLLSDNPNLSLDGRISVNTKITVNNADVGNTDIKEFFSNKSFIVINADEDTIFGGTPGDYNDDYNDDFNNN